MKINHFVLAASCVLLNMILAKTAVLLSLPVYLDSVGTIISVTLMPWYLSIATALCTSFLGALVINPDFLAYGVTQLTIVLVALFCFRIGMLTTLHESLISGLLIAVSAVLVSAPVTVLLFDGITWSETNALTAILLASGKNIWQSVIQGAIFIETIDKMSASLLAWLALRRLQPSIITIENR